MKKIFGILAFCSLAIGVNAQVKIQTEPEKSIAGENPFIDGSGYTKYSDNALGKGLYFPQTDLTKWVFKTNLISRVNFVTAFDGMIVYNTATGKTGTNAATQGIQVDVEPGFYYFYNPTGKTTRKVEAGKWVRIGGTKITEAESVSKIVGDKTVYVKKGEFTLATGDNGTNIALPAGMTSLYSINIFRKDGAASHLVGTSLYTYKLGVASPAKNIIFGSGIISTAYPAGTYEYVLEYIK